MRSSTRVRRSAVGVVLPVLLGSVLLAGCSGSDSEDAGTSSGGGGGSANDIAAGAEPSAAAEDEDRSSGGGDRTSARVLPGDRDIVYRGRITVRVKDVARAIAHTEDQVLAADGVVFSEETVADRGASLGEANLTLRVPPTQFKPTLDALGALGKELSRVRSAQDVTTELGRHRQPGPLSGAQRRAAAHPARRGRHDR